MQLFRIAAAETEQCRVVAKYNPDASGAWLPIVHGQGLLTEANGFKSQADVLIETRRAANLLGAAKMDCPEDVETNRLTNRVYVKLTNNTRHTNDQVDPANPRANAAFRHMVEMMPEGDDHATTRFAWEVLVTMWRSLRRHCRSNLLF